MHIYCNNIDKWASYASSHEKIFMLPVIMEPEGLLQDSPWNISVFIQIWNLMNVIMNILSELWSNQLNFEEGCCFGLINCCSFFITITLYKLGQFPSAVEQKLTVTVLQASYKDR
jgi:hypothetical protein